MTDSTSAARRPRVICHMIASLDGRILTDGWPLSEEGRRQYELVHESYAPDGWICGRVTMEEHFAQGLRSDAQIAREHHGPPREDYLAPGEHDSFAFAVDASGRLAWETSDIDGDHVVAILSERVSDEYLAFLRGRGVSHLLAGACDVDLPLAWVVALRQLAEDDKLAEALRVAARRWVDENYDAHKNTIAASLNGSVQRDVYYARARGYGSALESALFHDNVPMTVYDSLIESVHRNLPSLYRYYALRRRAMKLKDGIHQYDTYVPILADLSADIVGSALCDHERLATLPLETGMRYFRSELDDHLLLALGVGVDARLGVDGGQRRAHRLGLGQTQARLVVRDLALQVGEVDGVVVDDRDAADTGRAQVQRDG